MLGKHNFKERLRKMEKQDKHDRFSIRKLTIGAASVLIGFAFMGLNISSVQASSNPLDQIKEEQEQSNSNKGNNNSDQSDQEKPQINLEQVKNSQSAGQNSDQTEAANKTAKSDKESAGQVESKDDKPDVIKASGNKTDIQSGKADQGTNETKSASDVKNGETNKDSKSSTDKATGANEQASSSKEVKNAANGKQNSDQEVAGKENKLDVSKLAPVKDNSDLGQAANDLQNEINKFDQIQNTTAYKNASAEQKQQLLDALNNGKALISKYESQRNAKLFGANLTQINKADKVAQLSQDEKDSQTLDLDKFKNSLSGLKGLFNQLYQVSGDTATVDDYNDFSRALNDQSIKTIKLNNDINFGNNRLNVAANTNRNLVIDQNGKEINFGTGSISFNSDWQYSTITFNNGKLVMPDETGQNGRVAISYVDTGSGTSLNLILNKEQLQLNGNSLITNGGNIDFKDSNTISNSGANYAFSLINDAKFTIDDNSSLTVTGGQLVCGPAVADEGVAVNVNKNAKFTVNTDQDSPLAGIIVFNTEDNSLVNIETSAPDVISLGNGHDTTKQDNLTLGNNSNVTLTSTYAGPETTSGIFGKYNCESFRIQEDGNNGKITLNGYSWGRGADYLQLSLYNNNGNGYGYNGCTFISNTVVSPTVKMIEALNAKCLEFNISNGGHLIFTGNPSENGLTFTVMGDPIAVSYQEKGKQREEWISKASLNGAFGWPLDDAFGTDGNGLMDSIPATGLLDSHRINWSDATRPDQIVKNGKASNIYNFRNSNHADILNVKLTSRDFVHFAIGADGDEVLSKRDAGKYDATSKPITIPVSNSYPDDQSDSYLDGFENAWKDITITDHATGKLVDTSSGSSTLITSIKWGNGNLIGDDGTTLGTYGPDSSDPRRLKLVYNGASAGGITKKLSEIASENTGDLTHYPTIVVTYEDGSTDTVLVFFKFVGAKVNNPVKTGKNMMPSNADAEDQINNLTDITSQLGLDPTAMSFGYYIKDGTNYRSLASSDVADLNSTGLDVYIGVDYGHGLKQYVKTKLIVEGDADYLGNQIVSPVIHRMTGDENEWINNGDLDTGDISNIRFFKNADDVGKNVASDEGSDYSNIITNVKWIISQSGSSYQKQLQVTFQDGSTKTYSDSQVKPRFVSFDTNTSTNELDYSSSLADQIKQAVENNMDTGYTGNDLEKFNPEFSLGTKDASGNFVPVTNLSDIKSDIAAGKSFFVKVNYFKDSAHTQNDGFEIEPFKLSVTTQSDSLNPEQKAGTVVKIHMTNDGVSEASQFAGHTDASDNEFDQLFDFAGSDGNINNYETGNINSWIKSVQWSTDAQNSLKDISLNDDGTAAIVKTGTDQQNTSYNTDVVITFADGSTKTITLNNVTVIGGKRSSDLPQADTNGDGYYQDHDNGAVVTVDGTNSTINSTLAQTIAQNVLGDSYNTLTNASNGLNPAFSISGNEGNTVEFTPVAGKNKEGYLIIKYGDNSIQSIPIVLYKDNQADQYAVQATKPVALHVVNVAGEDGSSQTVGQFQNGNATQLANLADWLQLTDMSGGGTGTPLSASENAAKLAELLNSSSAKIAFAPGSTIDYSKPSTDQTADIIVTFNDGSSYTINGVHLNIIGGAKKDGFTTKLNEGTDYDLDNSETDAENALSDASVNSVTSFDSGAKFSWASDASDTTKLDTNYNTSATNGDQNADRNAYVIITYSDGTKQAIEVPLHINTEADIVKPTVTPGNHDGFSIDASGNLITHVNANSNEITPDKVITLTDASGNPITLTRDASGKYVNAANGITDVKWETAIDLTSPHALTDNNIVISYADGSTKSKKVPVEVLGFNGGGSVTLVSGDQPGTNTSDYEGALSSDDQTTLGKVHNANFGTTYEWVANANGDALPSTGYNTVYSDSHMSEPAYLKITYHNGTGEGATADGSQIIAVTLNLSNENTHYSVSVKSGATITMHAITGTPTNEQKTPAIFTNADKDHFKDIIQLTDNSSSTSVDDSRLANLIDHIEWQTAPDLSSVTTTPQTVQAIIHYVGGSVSRAFDVKVNVIGGKADNTKRTKIDENTADNQYSLNQDSTTAKSALTAASISNLTPTGGDYSYPVTSYSWAQDAADTTALDTSWSQATEGTDPADRTAFVILHYQDGSKQAVQVNIHINSNKDEYSINPSTGVKAITTHVGATHLADQLKDAISLTKGTGSAATTVSLSDYLNDNANASIVWQNAANTPDITKSSASNDYYAIITFADGSKSEAIRVPVTVLGLTGNSIDVDSGAQPGDTNSAKESALNSSDLSAVHNAHFTTSYTWVKNANGDAFADGVDYTDTTWSSTHDQSYGYLKVNFKNANGDDDGSEIVKVTFNLKKDSNVYTPTVVTGGVINTHVVNVKGSSGTVTDPTIADFSGNNMNNIIKLTKGNTPISDVSTVIDSIAWGTDTGDKPDFSQVGSNETHYIVLTYKDGSKSDPIEVKVNVAGATASTSNQSVISGSQPNTDGSSAINLPTNLPAGVTATVEGWVNATGDATTGYDWSIPTSYSTTWSAATGATNTATGYVRVHYSDGTDQIVPVTLNITSLANTVDSNQSDVENFNVHANATSADPTSHLTLKNSNGETLNGWTFAGWTTRSGSEGSYSYTDVTADGLNSDFNDSSLTNGTKPVTLYAKVTMSDGSTYYVPKAFTLTVIGAVAKGSASTNHGTSLTASDELQNYNTLHDDFGSDITSVDWTDAEGNAVGSDYWKNNTDNDHATNPNTSVRINGSKDAYITVKYSDGTKQTVWIPLKIKSDLDNNGSNITLSANSKDVHYGQSLSDADARGLLENNNNPIATGDVSATDATKEFKSIQWVNDSDSAAIPGTTPTTIGATGENDVGAHIKITFQDDSYIIKDVTVKVHSGYKNADQSLTINSGDLPSDDDAKAAIRNANDLSNNYNATSFTWAQDAYGTAMTSSYVTDGTNNDTKHAWVVITYTDGAGVTNKQVVQVNDLTIHNMANALTITANADGFKDHAVSTGSPDPSISSDDLKGYFTVKDGTADASSDVTSAAWTTGHTVDWTSTTAQRPQVTLTFTDGSTKSYELPTQLVSATVSDRTYTTNRNDVPNSDAAKGKVGNASDLSTYNPTYGWYSDASGTTALTAADVADPTPAGSPKTVYLKVDYHKGSTTGTADGYEIIPIRLTIQNSSANYRAGLRTGVTGLTLHVGQPTSDFEGPGFFGNNISNLITITKRSDGSVVSPSDGSIIGSITWGNNSAGRSTEPSTAANAPSSQTGEIVVIFRDDTASNPDRITVNVPVTILKATAKSDISTNHGHALTASDEISNLTDLNNSNLNFSAPAADVTWASNASGAALPSDFWNDSTDGETATDPADSTHQVSHAKGAYLIVHYKKGSADDGTQAIWVPVKIKSDKDNNGDNITLSANSKDVHYGQKLSDANARELLRNNGSEIAAGDVSATDSTKEFKSIQWVDGSGNVLTTGPATIPTTIGTTGENDVGAHIKITFQDDSYIIKDVTVKVHSGYNNTGHTENVVSGTVPSADDAKAAIANANDLINHYHATGFAWAKDSDGTAMDTNYVKSATNTPKSAWVKITYTDGATTVTQVVKVNDLKITSQANHYTPEPTENSEGQANSVTTHVNAPAIDMSTLPIQFKYTDAAGNTHYESLSDIITAGGSVAWNTNSAGTEIKPDLNKDSDGAHNFAVIITYVDGSTSAPVQVSVNVIGAKAKASASTNHDHALTASDEIDNFSTLSQDFGVASGDISWTDASGNPIDASTYWNNNTDHGYATNPTTNVRINGSKDAYITVKYGDGTHETVWIPLKINSDADNVDPETGIHFAGNVRAITVHADSHNADPSSHITIIETTTGHIIPHKDETTGLPDDGWTFSGWATRSYSEGAYHYTPISATDLDTDLNDSGLTDGKKDVNNIFAIITLHDNSKLYTPAMTIHVLGAVGQDVTFNHAKTIPNATTSQDISGNTAITNSSSLSNQFGNNITYTWMKNTGTAASPNWTAMTRDDFNTRAVNEPVIVRVKYGNDANTQDVHLNLTIHDDSDEIDSDKTNNASSREYDTHIGANINGSANLGNVDLKNAISFRDANNNPMFIGSDGKPTWTFAGFVNRPTSTTPINVDFDPTHLTNGVNDITNLYAYIKLHDGSYTHVKMSHVKVYGGYEAKTTTGSGASAVTTYPTTAAQDPATGANKDLTSEQAQAAIANSSDLNSKFSATGATALTYAWSTDGRHTGAGYKPDVSYNETTDNTKVRTAYVIITYGDGSTQSVQVHYNVKSLADRVDPSHTDDYNANNTVYDTHVNADILDHNAVDLSNNNHFEGNNGIEFRDNDGHDITSSVTGWTFVGWKIKSGNTYSDATASDIDVTDSGLTDGTKNANATNGKIYAELQMSDGSHAYIQMKNIKVYGGYTDAASASFAPGTDLSTTTSQNTAKGDITNNETLSDKFANGSTQVKYEWKKQSGSSYADIPVTDTTLSAGQTSKTLAASDGYGILITYGDGRTQFVKKDIEISTSDGEANNSRLSGTTITVEEGHTLTNGKNNDGSAPSDAQKAVLVNGVSGSTNLPAGTDFAFVGIVDTSTPGEKAAVVRVTYPDNSSTKPDTHDVNVIVKVLSQAEEYNPAGQDLMVNRNANVDRNDLTPESADAVRAQDGISNTAAMPANTTYSWSGANPDVSQAGSVVPAVIKVSFSDGSSDLVNINIHVNGTNPGSMASRFDPQGQNLRVHTGTNLDSITNIHDTDPAASGNKSFIANSSAMPIGTTYSWVTEPDTASVGTKTGVIKVTFADHSTKSLGVNIIVWNDASISTAPTGQNIHITSGQALNASDGIANKTDLSHVASSNGYTFTVTPSNINHGTASVTTPTAVIVHYADGSESAAVPIFVTVDPVTAPGTTPTDAERYHARGTTIVRNMNTGANLTDTDAHEAVVVDASGASAVQSYAWVNDDFKNTALHSSGLKAGYVKITFNDNSSATVLAYVDVKSASDRYAEQLSGKTTRVALNTPASDTSLQAQNNVNVPSSVPAGAISGYAWVAAPSTATVGTFPETVRVNFTDGTHVDVATTLVVYDNRHDNERNHDALSTNDITKYIGESITNADASGAIVDPGRLVGSPTFSFVPAANNNIVDSTGKVKAPAGNKWGIINVTYGDGSHDTVAVLVHVKSYAEEENPEGKNLTTDVNVLPNASDGIANKSSLTHVSGYTWASAPDVTTSGRTVNATVRVTYSDGSITDVPILVTVNGSMQHKLADENDPQGQNLRVHTGANISDPLHIQDTHRAASDPTSAIANSAEMPSGTTYSWVETPDVSTVGNKSGIIKVTFRDNSTKTVGITITVWNDASVSAVPEGQDIYKHVGDSINANEGIENTSALHNVSGYSFQGVTAPSTITAAAGTKPETVVVTYADGSTNLVPIQVIVAENTTPAPGTPDHRTDAQRYSAVGKTITKDLGSGALSSTDAQNAVTVQAGSPIAENSAFVWTSDNFKDTATNSTGLKSGFVTVTYRDGSQKQVRVYVNVQSAADRMKHAFTGKPETVNQGATIPAPSNGYGVQTSETVPSGTTYAWQTTPSSAAPGSFPESVVITFADHSHITVPTTLTVRDARTDADFNMPTAHDVTVHVGDSLPAASSALDNISSLAHYTSTTWQGNVDTLAIGDKPAVVVVHFTDGSHKDLGIIVHVVDDASLYGPQGKDLTTNANTVPNASDGISNKSSLPSGTSYAWVSNPDVSAAGTTVPGVIKVTYTDHSSETVLITIKVNGTENHNNAFSFTPEGKNLTTTVGHEPNAADGISNKWNSALNDHDNDSHHNLPDNAHFSWQVAPDVSTVGDKNAVIKVTYADHSSDEVAIIVKVTDDAHPNGHVVAPRGQNIETTIGHEPNAADGIANKSDLSNVSGYHFASPVDVSTAGTKAATVVVGFRDGSSQDVPVFVIVRNGSTPTPGVSHEADHYHPIGGTIDKDQSTTAHLNAADAKNAITNNSSLPNNASYAWTDPSFANNVLRTSGLKSGQVTITYHDGSQAVVDVFVKVTSDADRYNPSPRPVVVNPSDPNHPSDPSDPTNPTPGVDPSTVPSGTTTSWPKKADGTPDVPDTTVPGSHPTNIVITYPDGSHKTVPTVINVPDNRPDNERFNPSGKPFTIDPAHPSQSGDRTRPRDSTDPTNPMPGVDPSTVPAGTTTSWPTDASGNPTLPPTTPGDHNVHIVVHYPDGHTATVSTTVHVAATPAPSEPSYVAPTPDEDHDLVFFDPENNDQVVETLPDEIVGEAETDLPADSLRDLIATNIPDGYVLAPSFRISDMFMPTDTSAMRIPVLRRRLVFVTKQGKKKVVVAAIFGVIHGKQWSIISKTRMMALIKKYMPKGYKLANLYKIERTMITDHRDIEIPVQKKAKRHVRKTARHAKRHVARHSKRR